MSKMTRVNARPRPVLTLLVARLPTVLQSRINAKPLRPVYYNGWLGSRSRATVRWPFARVRCTHYGTCAESVTNTRENPERLKIVLAEPRALSGVSYSVIDDPPRYTNHEVGSEYTVHQARRPREGRERQPAGALHQGGRMKCKEIIGENNIVIDKTEPPSLRSTPCRCYSAQWHEATRS